MPDNILIILIIKVMYEVGQKDVLTGMVDPNVERKLTMVVGWKLIAVEMHLVRMPNVLQMLYQNQVL